MYDVFSPIPNTTPYPWTLKPSLILCYTLKPSRILFYTLKPSCILCYIINPSSILCLYILKPSCILCYILKPSSTHVSYPLPKTTQYLHPIFFNLLHILVPMSYLSLNLLCIPVQARPAPPPLALKCCYSK